MLGIGAKFPEFNLKAAVTNDVQTAFKDITNKSYKVPAPIVNSCTSRGARTIKI